MFNQQQQQLQQHLRQLQHLFQHQQRPPPQPSSLHPMAHHHHHHQQIGRPVSAPAQAPPPRMVRLSSASQATVMAPNPMMHGAVMMQQLQGSMQGFAMGGQQFTQFFSAGSRCSLLGPAPMGVAVKSPHMGFPPRHYHPHAQHYNKDFAAQQTDRRKESEQRVVRATDGELGAKTGAETNVRAVSTEGAVAADTTPSAQSQEGPALKKPRIDGSEGLMEEPVEANGALSSDYKAPADAKGPADAVTLEEGESMAGPGTIEFVEECRAPEVVAVGTMLKVTIQQSNESRAFNTGLEEQPGGGAGAGQGEARDSDRDAASKFFCYICSTTCHDQQSFKSHMNGLAHQQRMMEIQHMSNACLVTLLPRVRESLERYGEKRPGPQRWCATCQTHFHGDLIQHRRTKEHKLSKYSSRPFCTVCKRHFRTPRKFVEHMKSPEHKQRVEELREEGLPEVLEELITVDAVGCFEGEEDYEEEPNEQEEEGEEEQEQGNSHSQGGQTSHKEEVTLEDMADNEEYDPNTQYGSSFVVPVAGFLCRLCRKFYHFESTARLSHCQSLAHFQNLQKYRALRRQEDTTEPDPCSDGVEETHGGAGEQEEEEEEEEEEEKEEEEENSASLDPISLPLGAVSPRPRDRTVWARVPDEGHGSRSSRTHPGGTARPNLRVAVGPPARKRPRPGSPLDLTFAAAPLQGDSLAEESQRQVISGQRAPPSEDAEEPAVEDRAAAEEEEEEEKEVVAITEGEAAMGRTRATSKKKAGRTMRR
ncbi:zinc finger protein on ecdysone puffs-like isoform X2 [Conger conger]|uniref:zinc finger protein on ecdysone puffs-like isoform X2 n=1 Tax=Conger conger TaxID=82655 RepID=UPI002A5B0C50|nr:zinc finger protein on ecdysone puffs-like isoform X2 [Conger conger]